MAAPNLPDNQNGDNDITYFAESDYRNRDIKFGIKREDRTRHMYVIGKTGMGKTTLLENMAIQDLRNGNGLAFIDPHGEVADSLLDQVPKDRIDDVMYFAPFDLDHPISFNVMEDVGSDRRHLVADGLLSAFKKIWVDMWSGRMEYLLNNALLALLEYPDATILGVNRMFADKAYRKRVVANISDVSVRSFWEDEYAEYDRNFARKAASAIQNKVGQFVSNPQVRNIVGQTESSFNVREMMDNQKIMLINLSKGQVGEDNARLIGSMLITKMYLAAMGRANTGTNGGDLNALPQFYFYVDEFQSFANESFAGILSEARKYKLNLIIAHQYIEQMTEDVRNAVFGNVGTMVTFRVGAFDAEVLEKEFQPEFDAEDLVNLGFAQIYLKLMINGVSSKPFSARTLPPLPQEGPSYREEIRKHSRETYGRPREEVEAEIEKWHDSTYGIIDDAEAKAMAEKQRKQREAKKNNNKKNKGGNKSNKKSKKNKQKNKKKSKNKNKKQKKESDDKDQSKKKGKNKQSKKDKQKDEKVSLSDLESKKNNSKEEDEKSASKASRMKLKAALSSVSTEESSNLSGGESSENEDENEKSEGEEKQKAKAQKTTGNPQGEQSTKDQDESEEGTAETQDTPNEIPEDQLREMLTVDEEEE